MNDTLNRLGINDEAIKEDIEVRLNSVYRLGEMEEVSMGFED